jgi:uncharacterized protein
MLLRFTRFTIFLVLSICCFAIPTRADSKAGLDAYNLGDYETAMREWQPLAEQGDAMSQFGLGALYVNGKGVPQDYVQAREWLEKAAVQGVAQAQAGLGSLYLNGRGVAQDYQKASFWLRRAADQGDPNGQAKLGTMYGSGDGVPQDYVQAHMWFNLAAANGHKDAGGARDAIAKIMPPAQIAEAQRLAREWKPKAE